MRANRSIPPVTVIPVLVYPDVRAAVDEIGSDILEGRSVREALRDLLRRGTGDRRGLRDLRRFKDRRNDVDHVVELIADAALVLDDLRPHDRHTLPNAAEVRCDLLSP